jgi:Ig-like domain from next to BRCA1 gene
VKLRGLQVVVGDADAGHGQARRVGEVLEAVGAGSDELAGLGDEQPQAAFRFEHVGARLVMRRGQTPSSVGVTNQNRVSVPGDVDPGQNATFTLSITAPADPGSYDFGWRMRAARGKWFGAATPPCRSRSARPLPLIWPTSGPSCRPIDWM